MRQNSGSRYRVLVVDSENVLSELIKDTLLESGYIASSTNNAQDAVMDLTLKKVEGSPYDLIILDVGVGEDDSRRAILPVIREIDRDIRILVTSGDEDQLRQMDERELDISAKLTKPFGTKELLEAISAAKATRLT